MLPRRASLTLRRMEVPAGASMRPRPGRIRNTQSRRYVMRAIEAVPNPFTAVDIYRKLVESGTPLSTGTIHRVLANLRISAQIEHRSLAEHGKARSMYWRLFPAANERQAQRHYLVCRQCGTSHAFENTALLEELQRFTDWGNLGGPQHYVRLETENCAHCLAEGRHPDIAATDVAMAPAAS